MGKARIPIIKNAVYGEILYRLGNYKRYVSEFVDHFREDKLVNEEPHKKQSVLLRQMEILRKEGFLKTTQLDEEGKKLSKNKKLYYINFDKIIEELIDYSLSVYEDRMPRGQKYDKEHSNIYKKYKKLLNDPKFRDTAKKNPFINYVVRNTLENVRGSNFDHRFLTLQHMFDELLSLEYIYDSLRWKVYEEYEEKTEKTLYMSEDLHPEKFVKPELKKHYSFYVEFMESICKSFGIKSIVNITGVNLVAKASIEGFDKDAIEFFDLKF